MEMYSEVANFIHTVIQICKKNVSQLFCLSLKWLPSARHQLGGKNTLLSLFSLKHNTSVSVLPRKQKTHWLFQTRRFKIQNWLHSCQKSENKKTLEIIQTAETELVDKNTWTVFLKEKPTNIFQSVNTLALDSIQSLWLCFFYHSIKCSLLTN